MNDQNILKRHLQPAARKLGLPFVTWRCLRTSHATWLCQSGADIKSVQAQMPSARSEPVAVVEMVWLRRQPRSESSKIGVGVEY